MDNGNLFGSSSEKPRLLVLASTYPRWKGDHEPGFIHELSKRLTSRFEVTVLCPSSYGTDTKENLDGVSVVRYRYAPARLESLVSDGGLVSNLKTHPWKALLLPFFFLGQLFALFWLLRTFKPSVVHAHWLIPQGLCLSVVQLVSRRKIPFLVTSHGADLFALQGSVFRYLKRFVLSRSAAVTVVSRAMKAELKRLGVPETKIEIQPMGVDLGESFKPDLLVTRARNELLFVGRLVEKKGLRYLIEAMPKIILKFPDCELRIVGFGPEEERLRKQVECLKLERYVSFEGAVSNSSLPYYYRRTSVFVAPFIQAKNGDQEGLGLVLVEAIGCGCPAVVCDVPAVEDVTEGLEGIIKVPQKKVDAIADGVSTVLDELGSFTSGAANSSSVIKERFDWGSVAKRYEGILSKLVKADVF